ncbi:MAG TPA: EamA family transporter [Solirubrobacteraceae bacterium]
MVAVVCALGASACWGLADFFGGLQSRRLRTVTVVLGVETAGLLIVVALVLATGKPAPGAPEAAWAVGAGLAGVVGLGAFYRALAVGTMSIVAPVSSTGVALPVLVGLAGGDRLSAAQAVGLACAVVGVLLAGRQADDHPQAGANRAGVLLALAAAAGFGTYFLGAAQAAEGGVLWTLLLGRAAAVPVLAAVAAAARAPMIPAPADAARLAATGALDLAATGLYALATTQGLLAVVAVLGALYPVTTVLLARALLAERLTRAQDAGVVVALAGVALIAAG